MSYVKMPVWHKPLDRIEEWHFYDTNVLLLQKFVRKFLRVSPNRPVDKLLRGLQPYGGSGWWILTVRLWRRYLPNFGKQLVC